MPRKSKQAGKNNKPPALIPKTPQQKISALFFLPSESINQNTLHEVQNKLKLSTNPQLYLVMKSTGGDAYSAVRIMKHIRTKYSSVIGVIPDYVYSAATLMTLGTNKMLVSPEGYIGPIDKPMEHTESGEPISALDMTQSMSNLASLVLQQAKTFYEELRTQWFSETISKKDALQISWDHATKLVEPLINKIDPVLLQKAYRDLKIGMYYGIDLLNDGMLPSDRYKCFEIVRQLVNVYPSHGYAIFRDEMKKLGLIVEELEKSTHYQKIQTIYNQLKSGIVYMEDIYVS